MAVQFVNVKLLASAASLNDHELLQYTQNIMYLRGTITLKAEQRLGNNVVSIEVEGGYSGKEEIYEAADSLIQRWLIQLPRSGFPFDRNLIL
ncbi:hypothetical protein N7462_002252 [Penicillium macrosclerotiorum]|uniref:uncharacterized protein n=1 Tax=Penicillium macrosclerotiorum TaxID=303699 RepID=UPI002547B47E|nr:uncharacterized protein N7462_002252 [Penicillium macrosclerotiorum]KAJ5692829.1 hypothetical protein N7462_002252 [Penicillium macrosclerotiorum]